MKNYESRPTLLIVDDAPENLEVLIELLASEYRVLAANSGEACLHIASGHHSPDLILLDVIMPGMDGYAVMAELRANPATRDIPVIFLTALVDADSEERGLELGAVDYVSKPIHGPILRARVKSQLQAKRNRDWLRDQNAALEAEVQRRMAENNLIQQVSVRALAHLAETRDTETGYHLVRTQAYIESLALALKDHPQFSASLQDHHIEDLIRSAPLHDIGKVGIPDAILLKPALLTPEEREIMCRHASLGSDAIEQAEKDIEAPVKFLSMAKQIARWHHERWDGSGYPDRLAGDSIPVAARLMALADVFDALTTKRPYKEAMSCEAARDIIAEERGKHFDPDVVDAFLDCFDRFRELATQYRNREQ